MRKCGTCRYFRDTGIAASGWCVHPLRAEIHALVLVRRFELACRDASDNDHWRAASALDTRTIEGMEVKVTEAFGGVH